MKDSRKRFSLWWPRVSMSKSGEEMIRSKESGKEDLLFLRCVITMECGSHKMIMESMAKIQLL